jgi:hypothetical protein
MALGTATVVAGLAAARGEGRAITISLGMYSPESGSGSKGAVVKPKPTPKEPCQEPPARFELTVFGTTVTLASALSLGTISIFAQPSS